MSAFATLNTYANNPRARVALVAAAYEGLTLNVVDVNPFTEGGVSAAYLEKFPMGLVPTLEKDDLKLFEILAIVNVLASFHNKAGLLGATKEENATVQQWMSFANSHVLKALHGWFAPLSGKGIYNKPAVEASKADFLKAASLLEKTLADKTFLVGHRVTLADIFIASAVGRGFDCVLDAAFRAAYPNVVRHFKTVSNQPAYLTASPTPTTFIENCIVYVPPPKAAKVAAPAAPKAAKAPKAKEVDEEEDEPSVPAEPKAKHPAELLGAPKSFPLDEWKRQYSNSETVDAMKWLDEHYDAQDYSLWRVDYKYPTELTQVFMSANLIGGFHNRLEGSRKYLFGSAAVYGVKDDSLICGVYMLRGSNSTDVFDVAPDYESYAYTPLDFKTDRKFIEEVWSWTGEVDGKKHNDAKIFK